MLKLGVGGNTVSVSENVIKLVTAKEFKEKGKVVNLEKYDAYKEKERTDKKEEEVEIVNKKKSKPGGGWVRPELRVRCVDKKSPHYKDKLVVVDVVREGEADCRTNKGRLIQGLRTDRLETIVPKGDLCHVMVVLGDRRGEIGELLNRDKAKSRATVQLIMSQEVLVLDFDAVCEYAGSVPELE